MMESAPTALFAPNDSGFCIVELRDAKDSPIRGVGIAKCTIAAARWNAMAEEHHYTLRVHVSRQNGIAANVYVEEVPGGLLSHTIPEEADAKSGLVLAQMSSASVPWVSPLFHIEKSYIGSSRVEEFQVATAAKRRHMVGLPVLPVRLEVDKVLADLGVLDLIAPWLTQKDLMNIQAVSRSLRRAGIESKVVNRDVRASIRSNEQINSLKMWLIPRGPVVQSFSLFNSRQIPRGPIEHFTEALSEMVEHFRILKKFEVGEDWGYPWTPPAALWKLPLERLALSLVLDIPGIVPGYMQQLTELSIEVEDSFPEGLCQFRQLKSLSLALTGCTRLDFPPEVSQLSALKSLKMDSEHSLKSLSPHIGLLTTLQRFILVKCCLTSFPAEIYTLTALRGLELIACGTIGPLPSAIGELTALEELEIAYCEGIESLPSEISQLQRLQTLKISNADIKSLPPEIGLLSSCLRSLTLLDCEQLESLPSEIGKCTALEELVIRYESFQSATLTTLPPELSELKFLRSLCLSGCDCLHAIPSQIGKLSVLESLDLHYCEQLQSLPEEIGHLNSLTSLNLAYCLSLTSLPQSISRLTKLEELDINECRILHILSFADILPLTKLKTLDITACKELVFRSSGDGGGGS